MKKVIFYITTIAAILSATITTISYFHKEKIVLSLNHISSKNLLDIPKIDSLEVKFKYQNKELENFWISSILIKNSGSVDIIGKGQNKNIIEEYLEISSANNEIINTEIEIANFSIDTLFINPKSLFVGFKQWKSNEYLQLTIFSNPANNEKPSFKINDRDILNSEVYIEESIKSTDIEKNAIIYRFSEPVRKTLKWIVLGIYLIAIIIMFITFIIEIVDYNKYSAWKEKYYKRFYKIGAELVKQGIWTEVLEPPEVLESEWYHYFSEIPMNPDDGEIIDAVSYILFIIFISLPLLWII